MNNEVYNLESQQLHELICEEDKEALATAFDQCRDRLTAIISFRLNDELRSRICPDDVIQEVYIAALKRVTHYKSSSYTTPFLWFRSLLSQTLIDLHRKHVSAEKRSVGKEVRIDRPVKYMNNTSTSIAIQLNSHAETPDDIYAQNDMVSMIEKAINKMNEINREVLALRHFEGFTNSEVAEYLEISPKTASIRYVRAIKRLRDLLSDTSDFFKDLKI